MNYAATFNAIRQKFNTDWAAATPIWWENTPPAFDINAASSWVAFEIVANGANQQSMGVPSGNLYRHSGTIYAHIFTPIANGPVPGETLADTFGRIFQGKTFSGVVCYAPRLLAGYQQQVLDKGEFWKHTIAVPYDSDTTS